MENVVSGPRWRSAFIRGSRSFESGPVTVYGPIYLGQSLCRSAVYAFEPLEKRSKISEWFHQFMESFAGRSVAVTL